MRSQILAVLLLTAAMPAQAMLADPEDRAERVPDERSERPEPRFERPERAEPRPEPRFERPEPRFERRSEPAPEPRFERPAPAVEARAEPVAEPTRPSIGSIARGQREERRERRESWSRPDPESAGERRPADSVSGWRWREREAERRGRPAEVPAAPPSPVLGSSIPTADTGAAAVRSGSDDRRIGDTLRNRIATEGWRREWRRDRRYDWRRHRDWDRSRYHVGIYVDPFGWRYRHWDIGWRLPSRFYSSRYWIRDPWFYRLPPVYGPYRWIRYYDDVLLVDLRSGRVIDRIRNFFW